MVRWGESSSLGRLNSRKTDEDEHEALGGGGVREGSASGFAHALFPLTLALSLGGEGTAIAAP